MTPRTRLVLLLAAYFAIGLLLGPKPASSLGQTPSPVTETPATASVGPPASTFIPVIDLFDPVWDIMNRPRQNKGCVGCHIAPGPSIGPWFGADRNAVLLTLLTGINPDGDIVDPIPVAGGRFGQLGTFLRNGIMPMGGQRWSAADLELLDRWLILFE